MSKLNVNLNRLVHLIDCATWNQIHTQVDRSLLYPIEMATHEKVWLVLDLRKEQIEDFFHSEISYRLQDFS